VLTFSLQSGSNGNSIYVEADGVRLLFDAGISGCTAEARMARHRRDIRRVDALLISHDHSDHVRCAGVFHRRFKLPLYISTRTYAAVKPQLGPLDPARLHCFKAGQTLHFGDVRVHTVPTPHDAVDGVAFAVDYRGSRLGILTDLGHPFPGLSQVLSGLHAAYIESNYDPEMLRTGHYPWHLQERIRGAGGHLSNHESALLVNPVRERWAWAALAHLSEDNNRPEVAVTTHRRLHGHRLPLHVASRTQAGPVLEL
jgi:phosphoribosyl 1,2-cyclic phosphodiesterase